MRPRYAKVGIFGLGLLGGSVALGLKSRFLAGELHAYDQDPGALEAALALGAADRVHTELGPWVGDLDLAILAAPVGAIPKLIEELTPYASEKTLFTDVGSVKGPVVRAASELPRFVGGHPMAGSERAGIQNAHAGLLENAVWVLTPNEKSDPQDLEELKTLVNELGAYPLVLDPELHDRLVARVSHLPYLLAVALNLLVARDEKNDLLMFLAAGGFRDLTRVASGSPRMSRDMVAENREAVRAALDDLKTALAELEAALENPEELFRLAEEAKRTRDALPIVKRSLLPVRHELVVQVPDRPGELARITSALGEAGVNIKDIEVLAIRDAGGAIRLGFAEPGEKEAAQKVLSEIGYRVVSPG